MAGGDQFIFFHTYILRGFYFRVNNYRKFRPKRTPPHRERRPPCQLQSSLVAVLVAVGRAVFALVLAAVLRSVLLALLFAVLAIILAVLTVVLAVIIL